VRGSECIDLRASAVIRRNTMNGTAMKFTLAACLAMFAVGCGAAPGNETSEGDERDQEPVGELSQGKIIGANDLVSVVQNGANIPEQYRPLIDAFGAMSMGCTGTHIGDGIVLSAGHCFRAGSQRQNNVACGNVSIRWGFRRDKAPYLTSRCTTILAQQQNNARDYAIFRVSPVPPVSVGVAFVTSRAPTNTPLTIFGHPQGRALEWSKTCTLQPASAGGFGAGHFSHQCDTEPGSSGSSILDDSTLRVVGIHDGGNTRWNYATHLSDTPLAEFIDVTAPNPNPTPNPNPNPNPPPATAWSGASQSSVALRDNGQVCSDIDVAQAGNAADVKISISGQHSYRAVLRATLAHNGVTRTVFDVGSFPRTAGDFAVSRQAVAGFSGSAAGVWRLCITDTDAFGDTGTLRSWSVGN
jgi:V8-like Glu-specific endopeptidase